MRALLLLVPAMFLVACGGASSPAPAPSAAPAADGAAPGPCLAGVTRFRPTAALEEVGSLTVHLDKEACSIEGRAAGGASKAVPPCDPHKQHESVDLALCALGGDVGWAANPDVPGSSKVIELKVGRYTSPDPRADLALICAPFETLKDPATGKPFDAALLAAADPSQRARIRVDLFAKVATSRQWRLWLHDLHDNREAAVKTLRDAAKGAGLTCAAEFLASH